jgi:proteasome lid subunit RPN8/RPN11
MDADYELSGQLQTTMSRMLRQSARELCGFLLRRADNSQGFAVARNLAHGPSVFLIPEREIARNYRNAERNGDNVIAFVHSHSSSLELSTADGRAMRRMRIPWIIVALEENDTGLIYRIYQVPEDLAAYSR